MMSQLIIIRLGEGCVVSFHNSMSFIWWHVTVENVLRDGCEYLDTRGVGLD